MKYPKKKWGKPQKKGLSSKYVLALWSKVIKKRDGNKCVLCGSVHKIQAHHILKRGTYICLGWFLLENGATLCHTHHYLGAHDPYFPRQQEVQNQIVKWLKKKGIIYDSLYIKCKQRGVDLELSKILLKQLLS